MRSSWLMPPPRSSDAARDVPAMRGSYSLSTVSPTRHRAPPFCDTETAANPCCPLPNYVTPRQRREQRGLRYHRCSHLFVAHVTPPVLSQGSGRRHLVFVSAARNNTTDTTWKPA